MIRSKFLQLTIATALVAGAQSATACSTALWDGAPATATAGEPSGTVGPASFRRYSGRCGLKASAVNQTVTDDSPSAETTYNARFYVFTGGVTGEADIFNARNAANANIIRVTWDGTNFRFYKNGGTAVTVAGAASRSYGVEVRWTAAGANMTALVRGNNAASITTVSVPGPTGGVIDTAVLGWISGGTLPGGADQPNFDEFDSRRTSNIGFLCRGDANGDTSINIFDRGAVNQDILAQAGNPGNNLASGQPDANEDGVVNIFDRGVINTLISSNPTCAL